MAEMKEEVREEVRAQAGKGEDEKNMRMRGEVEEETKEEKLAGGKERKKRLIIPTY